MDKHSVSPPGLSDQGRQPFGERSLGERRQSQRPRRLMACKILMGGFGKGVIDCVLLDMTEGGARLETSVMTQVPERFQLRLADGTVRNVSRRWATGTQIGIGFEDQGQESWGQEG